MTLVVTIFRIILEFENYSVYNFEHVEYASISSSLNVCLTCIKLVLANGILDCCPRVYELMIRIIFKPSKPSIQHVVMNGHLNLEIWNNDCDITMCPRGSKL